MSLLVLGGCGAEKGGEGGERRVVSFIFWPVDRLTLSIDVGVLVLVVVVIESEVSAEVLRLVIYPVPLYAGGEPRSEVSAELRALAGSPVPHIK